MPFAYYGAKHGLARRYPPPTYAHIVEPFAGAAGYACCWATPAHQVTLIDKDPRIVALWHEYQQMSGGDLSLIERQVFQARCTHPFIAGMAGSASLRAALDGRDVAVTPRMIENVGAVFRRLRRVLPLARHWTILNDDWSAAEDSRATWFIDPPYEPIDSVAGSLYRHSDIDYAALGAWCRARRGQVIVCEQAPASWLPFRPLIGQGRSRGSNRGASRRVEVVWLRSSAQVGQQRSWTSSPQPDNSSHSASTSEAVGHPGA